MNTNSKRLGIYLAAMLMATTIATTLRSIACVEHLDNATGLFRDKSLINISNAIILLTIFGMLSYLFVATRISLRASFSTGSTYVPTGILGVATAFLGLRAFLFVIRNSNGQILVIRSNNITDIIGELMTPQNLTSIIGLLVGILAFVSIIHHFLNAFLTESHSIVRSYFAIATIAFLALYAIMIYLDSTTPVNEPNKSLRQFSFLFASVFFLYEARISLGREMWRLYTAFGLVAASLSAYTAIPAIVAYYANGEILSASDLKFPASFTDYINSYARSLASIEEYILLLAIFIFIVSRLAITIVIKEDKENQLVKSLVSAAAEQELRVSESFNRHKEIFAAKQLSIFDLYGDEEVEVKEEAEIEEEVVEEEEKKEVIISDDAIYESIFGKMPERPEVTIDEAGEDTIDDRDPEEIAEDLLNAVEEALKDSSDI